jgi:hypothetical protein
MAANPEHARRRAATGRGARRGGALARKIPLWQGSARFFACIAADGRCRSSVVEHPLGKGEVVSSILTGSTIIDVYFLHLMFAPFPNADICQHHQHVS